VNFSTGHFAHCESGVVASLLSHQGLNLSEPMVFGLAGGLTFAYLPFIRINGMPLLSYRCFPAPLSGGAEPAGRPIPDENLFATRRGDGRAGPVHRPGPGGGAANLRLLASLFSAGDALQFNAHNLIVSEGNGEFLISDPWSITWSGFGRKTCRKPVCQRHTGAQGLLYFLLLSRPRSTWRKKFRRRHPEDREHDAACAV